MATCLVTGSSGFIGKHLTKKLLLENNKVVNVSRKNLLNSDTILLDLALGDYSKINFNEIHIIYHLAGLAHDTQKDINNYIDLNINATVNLAKVAAKSGVKRFVFLSSIKAEGHSLEGFDNLKLGFDKVSDIYGSSKRQAESLLLKIASETSMDVSIIRPALVYGPSMKGNLRDMLLAIDKGWFPPLPKLDNRRSLIHIDDLIRAIIIISNHNKAKGETFLVSDGLPHSSREIYEAMCYVLKKPIPSWGVPVSIFRLLSLISPTMRKKIDKLLGDEYYPSEKISSIGFVPIRKLKEMNETFF